MVTGGSSHSSRRVANGHGFEPSQVRPGFRHSKASLSSPAARPVVACRTAERSDAPLTPRQRHPRTDRRFFLTHPRHVVHAKRRFGNATRPLGNRHGPVKQGTGSGRRARRGASRSRSHVAHRTDRRLESGLRLIRSDARAGFCSVRSGRGDGLGPARRGFVMRGVTSISKNLYAGGSARGSLSEPCRRFRITISSKDVTGSRPLFSIAPPTRTELPMPKRVAAALLAALALASPTLADRHTVILPEPSLDRAALVPQRAAVALAETPGRGGSSGSRSRAEAPCRASGSTCGGSEHSAS